MYKQIILSGYRRNALNVLRVFDYSASPYLSNSGIKSISSKKLPNRLENEHVFKIPNILLVDIKHFHSNKSLVYKEPDSKAEQTANLLKESIIKPESVKTDISEQIKPETRLSLWGRIVKELKHYYNGFKLLYLETKIASRLMLHVLNGNTLTRRERKQFTKTVADLFRLVPFSIFIIVPFMEFTLPIFLKLFPNMLPSTFKEESKEQDKLKLRLKAKLEMAKFLQDTLEETALKSEKSTTVDPLNQKFSEFMKKIRSKGQQPSNEDIIKYASLFENELTLDSLSRQQLIALCQILDVSTLGGIPPNHMLKFQLRMKIRELEADDKVILNEGVSTLDIKELQQACRERGMRAMGVSELRLRSQLEQWLDLHLNRKIPLSLLILSRALYLPENLPAEDMIKSTISQLPISIETATFAKIAEISGAQIDNKVKLDLLKAEDAEIQREEKESENLIDKIPVKSEKDFAQEQLSKEILVDKAETLSPTEIKEINNLIETLPLNEESQVKAEIAELKKDVNEYKEDVLEVEQLALTSKLTETKSAKLLGKRVQKLILDVDKLVKKLETDKKNVTTKNTVSIDELMSTIKRIRGVSNDLKDKKLALVLESLDKDCDGKIDDLNDVLKVFDLIEQENVNVTKDQLAIILTLLEKEKLLELQEEEQKAQQQLKQTQK